MWEEISGETVVESTVVLCSSGIVDPSSGVVSQIVPSSTVVKVTEVVPLSGVVKVTEDDPSSGVVDL